MTAAGRDAPPQKNIVPSGPNVQESEGKAGPVRTYQNLLQNADDENLFDHCATAQIALLDSLNGKIANLGKAAIFPSFEPAPAAITFSSRAFIGPTRTCFHTSIFHAT